MSPEQRAEIIADYRAQLDKLPPADPDRIALVARLLTVAQVRRAKREQALKVEQNRARHGKAS